ncbi:MAG: hypothetical protein HYR72_26380 [Deltaproteobacteria bacterium]|nr:hypothetical protein [Deltaproteobacteria bacterium]
MLDAGTGVGTTFEIPIAWDAVVGATGYVLERDTICDFPAATNTAVDEVGVNNGIYQGGLTQGVSGGVTGDGNTAVLFDGSTGFVDGGNNPSIDITYKATGLTLEAWVNSRSFPGYATVIGKQTNFNANYALDIAGGVQIRYFTANGGYDTQVWPVSLTTNTWYHVVLTHAPGGTVELWLNGVSQGTRVSLTLPIRSPDPVGIGTKNGTGPLYPFDGAIDEVAIYSHVLAANRIQAHYNGAQSATYRAAILADSPAAYWRLGEHGPTEYALSRSITAFGDTGAPPDDRCRFFPEDACPFGSRTGWLRPATTYFYRVRAATPAGEQLSNCVSAQLATGPVRGLAGDLWADVVLGKPDFGQNSLLKTTGQGLELPSGVLVDKRPTGAPSHIFIVDSNHNRILGVDHIGHCGTGQMCTTDADCGGAACALDYPNLTPTIVLGQDALVDKSACNGDGTGQLFPARAAASAASLCLVPPLQISIAEVIFGSMMDLDGSGALYVPDTFNNRVVKYDDPFTTDNVADTVWGQDDFAGNQCNKGRAADCTTLCLEGGAPHAGVAIDDEGNLWIADSQNARVLRFPKCPRSGSAVCSGVTAGQHAKAADVVLGQASCTAATRGGAGRGLDQLAFPLDVAFDKPRRILYVADYDEDGAARIVAFTPSQTGDFATGMAGTALPLLRPTQFPGTPPEICDSRPVEITMDSQSPNLWVRYGGDACLELLDVSTGHPLNRVLKTAGPLRGVDVDGGGNLFFIDIYSGLRRIRRAGLPALPTVVASDTAPGVFTQIGSLGGGGFSADAFTSARGVALLSDPTLLSGDQLVVADTYRLLIWNDAGVSTLGNGQAADDVFGAAALDDGSNFNQHSFTFPQVSGGVLWVTKQSGGVTELLAFAYPLCGSQSGGAGGRCAQPSTPVRTLQLSAGNGFSGYPVRGVPGTTVAAAAGDMIDFSFERSGNAVWVADRYNSRIFRIANLNGPGAPEVDALLGQDDPTATQCNRGAGAPDANTFCLPYGATVDPDGNLYVADNGGEGGTNKRLLEFDAAVLAPASQAILGPNATHVFGTGGAFDVNGQYAASDPYISPFKPTMHPRGYMIAGHNPYATSRFPMLWLSPLEDQVPQLALGDMTSYPDGSWFFDKNGNLYASDQNWSRVLIYKDPFGNAGPTQPPTATPTVTSTRLTPTITPTRTVTVTPSVTSTRLTPTSTLTQTVTAVPTATPTAVPTHDSVVVARGPLAVTIPLGQTSRDVLLTVTVRNADVLPTTEVRGHVIQLSAGDGTCPTGTVAGLPDFDAAAPGGQDAIVVAGGATKVARVPVHVSQGSFTTFNHVAPHRCTLLLSASTVVPGNVDPTPGNNVLSIELNVIDRNDPEQSVQHESVIKSVLPILVTIARGRASATRSALPTVVNADILPRDVGDAITVTASDGDCPVGTVGLPRMDGTTNVATLDGGRTKRGTLPLTITASGFATANAKSPARCTATLTATGPGGDTDASNNNTTLVIDVIDRNDF